MPFASVPHSAWRVRAVLYGSQPPGLLFNAACSQAAATVSSPRLSRLVFDGVLALQAVKPCRLPVHLVRQGNVAGAPVRTCTYAASFWLAHFRKPASVLNFPHTSVAVSPLFTYRRALHLLLSSFRLATTWRLPALIVMVCIFVSFRVFVSTTHVIYRPGTFVSRHKTERFQNYFSAVLTPYLRFPWSHSATRKCGTPCQREMFRASKSSRSQVGFHDPQSRRSSQCSMRSATNPPGS